MKKNQIKLYCVAAPPVWIVLGDFAIPILSFILFVYALISVLAQRKKSQKIPRRFVLLIILSSIVLISYLLAIILLEIGSLELFWRAVIDQAPASGSPMFQADCG